MELEAMKQLAAAIAIGAGAVGPGVGVGLIGKGAMLFSQGSEDSHQKSYGRIRNKLVFINSGDRELFHSSSAFKEVFI
ncbi:MAG: hypothetical protein NTX14_02230 [Candidatus Nealsonbacteria bacterium]|nr:hypothetical protein [Candidatus Nealsonbacteria bacterium]